MSDEARNKVDSILRDAAIAYSVIYVGPRKQPQEGSKPWDCDAWQTTLTVPPGDPYDFPFYTGLGHRKTKYPRPLSWQTKGQWEATKKPVAPHAADVLYSLLLDGEAVNMSFRDWCADYGYDNDSIKALNIYNECCKTGETLRRIFPHTVREALREALQDY